MKNSKIPVVIAARSGSRRFNKAQEWIRAQNKYIQPGYDLADRPQQPYELQVYGCAEMAEHAKHNGDFDVDDYLWRLSIRPLYREDNPAWPYYQGLPDRKTRKLLESELRSLGA